MRPTLVLETATLWLIEIYTRIQTYSLGVCKPNGSPVHLSMGISARLRNYLHARSSDNTIFYVRAAFVLVYG